MGLAFPSEDEMKVLFGFVTDEDRARWDKEGADPESSAHSFVSKLGHQGVNHGEQLAREQRQAARTAEAEGARRQKPHKTVRVITEHVREEPDLDPPAL